MAKLAEGEDPGIVDHVLPALHDSDKEVRIEAAKILGKLKDERAATSLVAALHDRESEVREVAADALREIGARQAMEPLVAALKDENTGVRWRAANALDALGWSPANDDQRVLQLVALGKLDKAANFGGIAIEPIMSVLKSGVYYKRMQAVEALSLIGDARVVKPLIAALRDEDNHVRATAVEALASIGDARAVEPLIAALRDKDNRVRASAVGALSKLGDPRAIDPLSRVLKDASWDVRMAALEALGKFKDNRVIGPLVTCLRDKDADARLAAVTALGKLNDPATLEPLILSLTDEQERVRSATAAVLRRLDKNWETSAGARRAIPALQQETKSANYWIRQAATDILAKISGNTEFLQAQTVAIVEPAQLKRQTVAEVLAIVLGDMDRDFRQAAAEALGNLGEQRAVEPLVDALNDADEWVRKAAAKSLETLKWQPTDNRDRARQLISLERWEEVIPLGETAVDGLLSLLKSKNNSVRKSVIETLGAIGSAKAAPAVAACLHDNFTNVRLAAAKALKNLKWKAANQELLAIQSVELQDWPAAIACGASAVEALANAAKEKHEEQQKWTGAEAALAQIHDPHAVGKLMASAADAELGRSIAASLNLILSDQADQVSPEDLTSVLSLNSLSQFHFEVEAESGAYAPVGMEEIDCAGLRELARQALERRGVAVS